MKIDQIAFGVKDKVKWDYLTKEHSEVTDIVEYEGKFENRKINGRAFLGFDYKQGIEREYLHYEFFNESFHAKIVMNSYPIFLSHLASHVDSIDYYLANAGVDIRETVVMDILTLVHSNPKVINRTYRYVIMDWRMTHGYFYKLIQRIEKPRTDID